MKNICYVLLILVILLLCGCGRKEPVRIKPAPDLTPSQTVPGHTKSDPDAVSPTGQLLCRAESLEEAESLAELYGITLVSFNDGLAVFYTEEDPRDVIQRGRDNGWPELSRNVVRYLS